VLEVSDHHPACLWRNRDCGGVVDAPLQLWRQGLRAWRCQIAQIQPASGSKNADHGNISSEMSDVIGKVVF